VDIAIETSNRLLELRKRSELTLERFLIFSQNPNAQKPVTLHHRSRIYLHPSMQGKLTLLYLLETRENLAYPEHSWIFALSRHNA
jgi:hypothetical protein